MDMDFSYMGVGFEQVKPWLEACTERWQAAWESGSLVTVDESMI